MLKWHKFKIGDEVMLPGHNKIGWSGPFTITDIDDNGWIRTYIIDSSFYDIMGDGERWMLVEKWDRRDE